MVVLLLPLSDMKHLFDFKPFLGHLVQGCVIVLTRHLLHIDTIITLLWQSGLSWLWFLWNLLLFILYIGNMVVSCIALMRNESPKHVSNSCPHALFQNLIRNVCPKKSETSPPPPLNMPLYNKKKMCLINTNFLDFDCVIFSAIHTSFFLLKIMIHFKVH